MVVLDFVPTPGIKPISSKIDNEIIKIINNYDVITIIINKTYKP